MAEIVKADEAFFDTLEHFDSWEFSHPYEMDRDFLGWLNEIRDEADTAFVITSDYRPGDPRTHGKGWAVDIACASSHKRFAIMRAVILHTAEKGEGLRMGVYDKHVHLDCGDDHDMDNFPPNVIWWGKSR